MIKFFVSFFYVFSLAKNKQLPKEKIKGFFKQFVLR